MSCRIKYNGEWKGVAGGGNGDLSLDAITIDYNSSSELSVKDNGLTVAKFNSNAISTEIADTGSNDKLPTERAVRTELDTKLGASNIQVSDGIITITF